MQKYVYKPIRFYIIVFTLTWLFWITAAVLSHKGFIDISTTFMMFGLFVPAITAIVTVLTSKNKKLKEDLKNKIIGFYRIRPLNVVISTVLFLLIVAVSILISILFGQSADQFSITDFSFSVNGTSALLTIILASVIEELGWRGYGEDAIASRCSWFKESVIFGIVWSVWHIPLFFIDGTYHYGLSELGIGYVLNFLISVIPLGFITTWVYVKNNRSMLASIIFHFFVNFFQEKIAMTPETKCIETAVIIVAAVIIVVTNKKMFFETDHVGNFLEYQPNKEKSA